MECVVSNYVNRLNINAPIKYVSAVLRQDVSAASINKNHRLMLATKPEQDEFDRLSTIRKRDFMAEIFNSKAVGENFVVYALERERERGRQCTLFCSLISRLIWSLNWWCQFVERWAVTQAES